MNIDEYNKKREAFLYSLKIATDDLYETVKAIETMKKVKGDTSLLEEHFKRLNNGIEVYYKQLNEIQTQIEQSMGIK